MNSPEERSNATKLYVGRGSGFPGNGRPSPGLKHDHLFAGRNSTQIQPCARRFARDTPPDSIALPRAFAALLHALARSAPVLLAIDDVQWLDPESQAVVSFAARRL